MNSYRRVLVPVDGSITSNKALVAALQIARDAGGCVLVAYHLDELDFLTGFESGAVVLEAVRKGADKVLSDAYAIAKAAGVAVDARLLDKPGERLGESIAAEARVWQADLVVVGTHGRRGVKRVLLGSGAEQVIRMAPVPVLVIRGEEDEG